MKFILRLLSIFALTASCLTALGQEPEPQAAATAPGPVKVFGREIVTFSSELQGKTPQQRSEALRSRLERLKDVDQIKPDEVSYQYFGGERHVPFFLEHGGNRQWLFQLTEADANASGLMFNDQGFSEVQTRLRALVSDYLKLREPKQLLMAILWILLSTAAYIVIVKLVLRSRRWLRGSLDRGREGLLRRVPVLQGFLRANIRYLLKFNQTVVDLAGLLGIVVATYVFVPLILSFLPWTASWSDSLFNFVLTPIQWLFHGLIQIVPNLFFIAIIIMALRFLLKFILFLFEEIAEGAIRVEGFHPDWALPTYKIVRMLVIALGIVISFPYIPGSSSPAFQGVSVFIGVLVSFGSSSAIGNIVAGVVITYMRPFRVGDRVKIADTVGDVIEKELLVTRIRTIKNEDITIPNSLILASHIINYSVKAAEGKLILNTTVTIGYDVPWVKVHEALIEAANRTKDIHDEMPPFVLQKALNDYNVAYELNAYTREASVMAKTYSELHGNIQDVFGERDIEILSPAYTSLRDGHALTLPGREPSNRSFQVSTKS